MYQNYFPNFNQFQPYNFNQSLPTNTNKIYVNGLEDVRNRPLQANSDFIFLDNDKPLIYQKIVDSKGQFEVKTFQIQEILPQASTKQEALNNLPTYVEKKEFDKLLSEFESFRSKFVSKKGESNGTTTNGN